MKSCEVNRIVEVLEKTVLEGEDLESVDSALWEQLEVYSEDAELEGFRVDVWEEEVEVAGPDLLPTLAPVPAPALAPAPAPVPLRRLNRRKK